MAETIVPDEIIARMVLYQFLSSGYTYPSSSFVDVLFADKGWNDLQIADTTLSLGAGQIMSGMQDFVRDYSKDAEKLLLELEVEYTYLFINAVPRVPAPPYESVYTGTGLLMDEPVSQVLQAYREAGLGMREDDDALPDHIATEMEFMSYLVRQQNRALQTVENGDVDLWQKRQRQFLEEHLLRWCPGLMEKVVAGARQPFYRLMSNLTDIFLQAERERFCVTV